MKRVGIAFVVLAVVGLVATWTFHSREPRAVVAPKRATPVGISPGAGIRNLSDAELAADMDRMVELGVTWIRLDIDWSVIEPRRGSLQWESTDRMVKAAADRDLDVLGLLAYTPPWARRPGSTDKHPPTDAGEFARFAAAAADRYRTRISSWEVWNEPNLGDFWAPAPDPGRYGRLLRASTDSIRSVDPDSFVISGGLAPAADGTPNELSPETFLRELYETLPPGVVDGVGIHPYSFPVMPSDDRARWNLFSRLPEIRDLVNEAEGRPTPLWLTEFGAPFDPDDPRRQAEILEEGVACAIQWPFTGPVFVYALRDLGDPGHDQQFGLFSADSTARPAWARLRDLLAIDVGEPVSSACGAGDNESS